MTSMPTEAALHDAYAAEYDEQVRAYECYLAEALFGLCYEYVRPGDNLLDVGIGSGLSAAPFAKAGLRVWGVDFSPVMLDVCRVKAIAEELKVHDLQVTPWPYAAGAFDHVISCGLLHFIADLDAIFSETARVLRPGGLFAFTTKSPAAAEVPARRYERLSTPGGPDVFDHFPAYVGTLIAGNGFERLKVIRCFVGQDIFYAWAIRKTGE